MIPNGNVLVIGQQWGVWAKQPANPCGVMDGGIEVGVIANLCRKLHRRVSHRDEQWLNALLRLRISLLRIEERAQMTPQRRPRCRPKRHQGIEKGSGARSHNL